jgi:hypothetical protein
MDVLLRRFDLRVFEVLLAVDDAQRAKALPRRGGLLLVPESSPLLQQLAGFKSTYIFESALLLSATQESHYST